jgi:maltose/moltooligosaccharide transporter
MLLAAVLWTVLTSREYSPGEMAAFGDPVTHDAPHAEAAPTMRQGAMWIVAGAVVVAAVAGLGLDNPLYILGFALVAFGLAQVYNRWRMAAGRDRPLNHILSDLNAMPQTMRRLALIQFLSWFALFILFIYATPIVAEYQFGATDPTTRAYNNGADWVGVLLGVYNGVAALWAFAIPALAARIGAARLHAINLVLGGIGLASIFVIRDPTLLLVSMVGVGMAWASILTVPYAILCGSLPASKLGVYMGLFNIFIVLPQLVVSTVMGSLARHLYPEAHGVAFLIAGAFMVAAALASLRLEEPAAVPVARASMSAQ